MRNKKIKQYEDTVSLSPPCALAAKSKAVQFVKTMNTGILFELKCGWGVGDQGWATKGVLEHRFEVRDMGSGRLANGWDFRISECSKDGMFGVEAWRWPLVGWGKGMEKHQMQ